MPRGEFKHRYWFFTDAPNIGRNVCVIWKDLLLSSYSYRLLKYRGGCTIPLFQISVRCEKCAAARHYAIICKQLLIANGINRVRWVVLYLQQDGACTDFFENRSENSLQGDLSNATTFNPPLFSLVDTFKGMSQEVNIFWIGTFCTIINALKVFTIFCFIVDEKINSKFYLALLKLFTCFENPFSDPLQRTYSVDFDIENA